MNGEIRRNEIIRIIEASKSPVSGGSLADSLGVSRQIIVSDIALLRASGQNIISTHKGYIIKPSDCHAETIVKVMHTDEEIFDELCTIVDFGGIVLDVFVRHKVYGTIRADLNIKSRKNIMDFLEDLKNGKSTPLKNITSNYHYHTIRAENHEILSLILSELEKKGYLIAEKK